MDDIYERIYLNRCKGHLWVMDPWYSSPSFEFATRLRNTPINGPYSVVLYIERNDPVRRDRNESHHYARDVLLYLLIRSGSDCDRWSCRKAPLVQRTIDVSHLHVIALFELSSQSHQYFCSLTFSQSKIFTAFIRKKNVKLILQLLKKLKFFRTTNNKLIEFHHSH